MPLLNIKPAQKSNLGFTQRNQATPTFVSQGSTITVSNTDNLSYDLLEFDGLGSVTMRFTNCNNLTIKRIKFKNITGNNVCIEINNCDNVVIQKIYLDNVTSGIYAVNSDNVHIKYIYAIELQEKIEITSRGQIAQFNKCTNSTAGVLRLYNPTGFNTEDVVNEYGCTDCRFYDIAIRTDGTYNGSMTGGLIGDGGVSEISQRNIIEDVISVNGGQAGVAIAGGLKQTARNLKVFGTNVTFSNVGVYVARYSNQPDLIDARIENLYVNFTNAAGNPNNVFVDTVEPNASYGTVQVNVNSNVSYINANMLPAGDDIVNEALFHRICLAG